MPRDSATACLGGACGVSARVTIASIGCSLSMPEPAVTACKTVTAIRAVIYGCAARPGGDRGYHYPVNGSADLVDVVHADGWELPASDLGRLDAYLADITFDHDMALDTTSGRADG